MSAAPTPHSSSVTVKKVLLIALMAIGSVMLWLGIPLAWIYAVSSMVDSSQPSMGPYLAILFGIPISMVICGKGLAKLNGVYANVTGEDPEVHIQAPWLKSMRAERDSGRKRTVLDVVMVISVGVALFCFGVWFFLFAGSSLPGT